jgi:L-threonylcarbamoyladenylate synthase
MRELFEEDIVRCLEVLKKGGTILYPTDTIWGIGCDATNKEAVQKVFTIKKRDDSKSLIVLVADERDILQLVAAPDLEAFDYLAEQDRPTTMIYEGALGLPDNLVAADGSIAIRIVQDEFCRHLIRRLRKPLVSTSANISGAPSPQRLADVSAEIKRQVDYIVHWRQDDTSPATPSRIVKWNGDGSVTIIRE